MGVGGQLRSIRLPCAGAGVGPKTVVEDRTRLGIASDLDPVSSIALGSSDVRRRVVRLCGCAPTGGIGASRVIAGCARANGKQLDMHGANANFWPRDDRHTMAIEQMMQEKLQPGTARKGKSGWQAAGKTGTARIGATPGSSANRYRSRSLARQRRLLAGNRKCRAAMAGRNLERFMKGGARGPCRRAALGAWRGATRRARTPLAPPLQPHAPNGPAEGGKCATAPPRYCNRP